MSRRRFLLAGAALAGTAAVPFRAAAAPGGLVHRGVGYEVADGEFPETGWDPGRMAGDVAAIATRLHADSVSVFGTGVDRLARTAEAAAARGLHVWLQPRLGDVPPRDILDHLGEAGRRAEALRRQGADIDLSVGCEFVLFVPGIVPGADPVERVHNLLTGRFDPARLQRRLAAFIAAAARTGRASFGGRLSYAAAADDIVDWSPFDVVGIDYYAAFPRAAQHLAALRRHARVGKPVAIAEFGACTYRGAPARGGLAWDVLDASGQGLRPGLVRSEGEQAAYLARMLRIFAAAPGVESATVYQFVTPDAPHRAAPRRDLDMASYAIVKPVWATRDRPTPRWHWRPKEAFDVLAREFRRAA